MPEKEKDGFIKSHKAVYFPSPLVEEHWTCDSDRLAPLQCDLIRSIMGFVIKFENEFFQISSCQLQGYG